MRVFAPLPCAVIGLACLCAFGQTVNRGRNEGTMSIVPSNPTGNGNLALYAKLGGSLSEQAVGGTVLAGGQIGIAEIMQLWADASFVNFRELGPADAHLSVTFPGNDKLRFFGLAVAGDLYLSTSIDSVTFTADAKRPLFNPYLMPSLVTDLDWLAVNKRLPLKTYLSFGLVDDPQLLYRYDQLAFVLAGEWKMYEHSLFVDAGMSLYKEKPNKLNRAGDDGYNQAYVWLMPGGRYRLLNRFCIVGGLGVTVFQNTRPGSSLTPNILSLQVRVEAPIIFRETNTEAIRTLVFMQQKQQKQPDSLDQRIANDKGMMGELGGMLTGLQGAETFDYAKEQDTLARRREEIQKKMEAIEKIMEEIDKKQ